MARKMFYMPIFAVSIKKIVFILESFTFLLVFTVFLRFFRNRLYTCIMFSSLYFLNFQAFKLYASLFQQYFSRNCHVNAHIMKITIEFSSCNYNCNRNCDCDCNAMIAVMAYGYKQCIYRGKL